MESSQESCAKENKRTTKTTFLLSPMTAEVVKSRRKYAEDPAASLKIR